MATVFKNAFQSKIPTGSGVTDREQQLADLYGPGSAGFSSLTGKPQSGSAAPTGGGGGGGNPYYNDPGIQQMQANLAAAGALDASERQRLIQQSLIKFGMVPEGLKDPYGDVTDLVRNLAGEKTTAGLSTYSRLQDWNKLMISRLKRALAARGALHSGELGFGLGRQDLGYRQSYDDAVSQLLDYVAGAQYAFANSELNRQNQAAQGLLSANPYIGGVGGGGGGAPAVSSPASSLPPSIASIVGGSSGPLITPSTSGFGSLYGDLRGSTPTFGGIVR